MKEYNKEEYNKEEKNTKKSKKRMNKGIRIFFIFLLVIVIIISGIATAGYIFMNSKFGKIQNEKINIEEVGINEEVEKRLDGYRNVALLGIDSRQDDYGKGNRSDCIIIASLNEKTNEVKLISVYRDTFVNVEENGKDRLDKITHAYSYGGPQNTLKSLNEALDLNITEYVTVNFDAVVVAVNAMGGINIKIEPAEIKYINNYIDETSKVSHTKSHHINNPGVQKLDGVQAVAYSRIRYTAGGDQKRAERMRTVVSAMIDKAKTLNMSQLNNLADIILPKVRTNIDTAEIWKMVPKLITAKVEDSFGWPYQTKGITLDRWYGVPVTLEENVIRLHKEVFEEDNYVVSDTVKEMSNKIIKKTGYR